MAYKDMREFIASTPDKEIVRVEEEISLRYEIAAVLKQLNRENGRMAVFHNIKEIPGATIAGNLLSNMGSVARAFDTTLDKLGQTYLERKRSGIESQLVETGPVKEVVETSPNLKTMLPVPVFHQKDAGQYITAGLLIAKDPVSGKQSMGVHRLQVKNERQLRVFLANPPLADFFAEAESKNRPLEIAVAVGCEPLVMISAVTRGVNGDIDKFRVAGGLRQEPVELVKAETVDVDVPAEAEVIIEGRILPHIREKEGPFGESSGYYFGNDSQVIEVSAITHRQNPIFQALYPWGNEVDNLFSLALGQELLLHLKAKNPKVQHAHLAQRTCGFHVIVSVSPMDDAEVRYLMERGLKFNSRIKQLVIVDEDVNIYDPNEINWALATRFQAHRDIFILSDTDGYVIDPSLQEGEKASSMAMNATKPEYSEKFEKITIPEESIAVASKILGNK